MTNTTTAIPTNYRGYSMRSRLEARWAVFLDALRVRWIYEHQGFDLGSLGWYLPDFYLPEWRIYLEIKPTRPDHNSLEMEKCRRVLDLGTDAVLLCSGLPNDEPATLFCHDLSDSSGGQSEWNSVWWTCEEHGLPGLYWDNSGQKSFYADGTFEFGLPHINLEDSRPDYPALIGALNTCRSYRFGVLA